MNNNQIIINTDGGSRGNPGPAAIGVVFSFAGKVLHTHKKTIGIATNNEAEYRAIIEALKILLKSNWYKTNNTETSEVLCLLDSLLVVEQLNGNYKAKQAHIQDFIEEIKGLTSEVKLNIIFKHIPREENKKADKLVNEALDEEQKK